jgi:hypothetical protein
MSLISRLERRFGRFAIPNLTTILIVGQACLFISKFLPQGVALHRVALDPARVLEGEVWRLVTFLFTPPNMDPIFVVFYFLLLHLFGSSLEHYWGVFRYNVFLWIGYAANVAAAFAASGLAGTVAANGPAEVIEFAPMAASNAFLYSSIFLAFARLCPDFIINLFFVLPIRIKWLALLMWLNYGYQMLIGDGMTRMLVVATVLNYVLFFGPEHWRELRHGHRKRSFKAKAKKATAAPRHECVVCGLNSDDSPRTLFRYCSKCAGQR